MIILMMSEMNVTKQLIFILSTTQPFIFRKRKMESKNERIQILKARWKFHSGLVWEKFKKNKWLKKAFV